MCKIPYSRVDLERRKIYSYHTRKGYFVNTRSYLRNNKLNCSSFIERSYSISTLSGCLIFIACSVGACVLYCVRVNEALDECLGRSITYSCYVVGENTLFRVSTRGYRNFLLTFMKSIFIAS